MDLLDFSGMSLGMQCMILAGGTLMAVFVGLKLYNRREARREHAFDLAILMSQWELDWLADLYKMYTIGDYSGLVGKIKQVVQAVRSDEAMARILLGCAKKVVKWAVDNDPVQADAFRALLDQKTAKK